MTLTPQLGRIHYTRRDQFPKVNMPGMRGK